MNLTFSDKDINVLSFRKDYYNKGYNISKRLYNNYTTTHKNKPGNIYFDAKKFFSSISSGLSNDPSVKISSFILEKNNIEKNKNPKKTYKKLTGNFEGSTKDNFANGEDINLHNSQNKSQLSEF